MAHSTRMEVERCAHTQHHRWNASLVRRHPLLLLGAADTYEQDARLRRYNLPRHRLVLLGRNGGAIWHTTRTPGYRLSRMRTNTSSSSGVPPYSPIGMPCRAARSTTCVVKSVPRTCAASLTPKLLNAQTRGLPSGVIRSAPFTTRWNAEESKASMVICTVATHT
jgi:hypothetical protein